MAYLLSGCQIVLAVVLLLASTSKILVHTQFSEALRLSYTPGRLVKPVIILTPAIEMGLALGLALNIPSFLPALFASATALFFIFTLWMSVTYARGLRLKCGCFGAGGSDIGPYTILRNILLIAVSLGGMILAVRVSSVLPLPSYWSIATVVSLAMAVALLWALQQAVPGLAFSLKQLDRITAKAAKDSAQ